MNFESLPPAIQKFIAETGIGARIEGIGLVAGDASDNEAMSRYLSPRSENLLLSHYTSWERLEEALRRQSLRMTRIDNFKGDTQDGTFPAANRHSKSAMDNDLHRQFPIIENRPAMLSSHEEYRKRAFAHCWFEGWKECPKMWKDYGWDGIGVCIQTRSLDLFNSANQTSEEFDLMLGGCFYRNDSEPIPTILGSMPLFCKRREFSDEKEVRLVAAINENRFKGVVGTSQWLPLRTMEFIERLILGPKMPQDVASAVKMRMKQLLPNIAVLSPIITASEIV